MSDRVGGEGVRIGIVGFVGGLPFELVAATSALGLEVTPGGEEILLVDARGVLANETLAAFQGRTRVALAYGSPLENDPAFDGAFDDVLPPGSGEGFLRRRLGVALRLSGALSRPHYSEDESRAEALRMANSSLEFALRRFEALFQGLPAACFTMDVEGTIHEWNREATAVFGLQPYEAVYRTAEETFGPEWTPARLTERLDGSEPGFDWEFQRPDGRRIHLDARLLAITSEGGERTAIVAANLDVTERVKAQRLAHLAARRVERARRKLQAANAVLNSIALTDPLTGLGNRRRFEEILAVAREREARNGVPFALLLLDIDRFKAINDDFGHTAGDEVLRALGGLLKATARKMETPVRLGGEEFALVLEGCDDVRAMLVAERIRTAMMTCPWPNRPVTASFGVATARMDESDDELYARADAALYDAKRGGRDQACLAA